MGLAPHMWLGVVGSNKLCRYPQLPLLMSRFLVLLHQSICYPPSVFWPIPNQFMRPYSYLHFLVLDDNLYLCVPSPSFPHFELLNSTKLQDMTCSFPFSTIDQVKPFQNSIIASGPNFSHINSMFTVHRSILDIEVPPPPKSPFYTPS